VASETGQRRRHPTARWLSELAAQTPRPTLRILGATPGGFTVAELDAKVQAMTRQTSYTIRQAAYDLRKLRGKELIVKPGRSRRYQVPPQAARTSASLLALRDQVIGPILAGVRSPGSAASPPTGPPSTATTRPSALACRPSSSTWALPPAVPRHRQPLVDPASASA
jgi:hypothetical protein